MIAVVLALCAAYPGGEASQVKTGKIGSHDSHIRYRHPEEEGTLGAWRDASLLNCRLDSEMSAPMTAG